MEKTTRLLQETLAKCKKGIRYVFFFSLFVNLLMLTVPIFMLLVFDYVLTSFSGSTLIYLGLIAFFALMMMGALDIIRGYVMRRVAFWYVEQLNTKALKKAACQIVQGHSYGTQSLRDLESIRTFLTSPTVFSLFDMPWTPLYIAIIFLLHPILGWFAVAGALVLFVLGYINEFASKHLLQQANTESIKNQQGINMVMRNIEVIQAMGMMDNIVNRWKKSNAPVEQLQQQASDRTNIISSLSKFIRLFLQLGVLAIGASLVIGEQLTPGGMIAASILLSRALAPAEQSIAVWKQLINIRQAFDRLKSHFITPDNQGLGVQLPTPTGKLSVDNIVYQLEYMNQPIVSNINFELQQGEMLALVGPSGAGKSTLARLMAGILKPTKGCIRLDGADVFQWERTDFGKHLGYVPQDIELLPGTFKENIARMGDIIDEEIIKAATLAGAHEVILSHPSAYDTEITVTTNPLSGGQRQRLALARAYYGNPKLLILDEPNSNLDSEGEKILFNTLEKLRDKGLTIIIITHHIPALQIVDKIALLANGNLVTIGPREQILRSTNEAKNIADNTKNSAHNRDHPSKKNNS